jgi:DNA transformation protein
LPLSPGFTDYAVELLAGLGRVQARRMFGGAGLFRDGVMFALLDDDVIYLRVDDALQAELRAQGSVPWVYSMKRDGAVRDMGYWRMPETAADDPDEAVTIARRAYTAAVKRKVLREAKPARSKAAKSVSKKPTPVRAAKSANANK